MSVSNFDFSCSVCNLTHPMATFLENHIIEQVNMLWLLLAYSIILNLECTSKKKKIYIYIYIYIYKIILS